LQQPPDVARAIHLVPGAAAAASLRRMGARQVAILDDRLSHGPSAVDPGAHARARRGWSREAGHGDRGGAGADLARTLDALPADLPVVLWTSEAWRDVLAAAWALHTLLRARVTAARVRVASTPGLAPLAGRSVRDLSRALACARPLSPGQARAGAALWRAFAARTPGAIERFRRRGGSPFPAVRTAALHHAALFPRASRGPRGYVALSVLDQALLDGLSTFWWRDAGEVARASGRTARELAAAHGEAALRARLLDWTGSRPAAVEFRVRARRGAPDLRFRITAWGKQIRSEGLAPRLAPPFAAGGQVAYRGRPLWVLEESRGAWRLRPRRAR
jgi:hypothetical protein